MLTLCQSAVKPETVPATTAWYLADLGEARGKQALFTKQSPQLTRGRKGNRLLFQVFLNLIDQKSSLSPFVGAAG